MAEYLVVYREISKKSIDNYYQINYNELIIWIPLELSDAKIEISLNPWASDLPNRELLVSVQEEK